jgi:hypothetical protein
MSKEEEGIKYLVNEYNQVEAEQNKRLENIFLLMDERKGYQAVKFSSGDMWSNCFGRPRLDLRLKQQVYSLARYISEVVVGED